MKGLKEDKQVKGPLELKKDIIQTGLCTLCGACVGICPYNLSYRGRLILLESCELEQGRCYAFCPRTGLDLEMINQAVFKMPYLSTPLGHITEILMARSKNTRVLSSAQYGGIVSTLLISALTHNKISKAILTRSGNDMMPRGYLISSSDEVINCAGSNYAAAPTLEALNRIPNSTQDKIAVVGVPCQIQALGKMLTTSSQYKSNIAKVEFSIGLFCTWALDYERLFDFLKKNVNIHDIKKMDIPPPPANIFQVFTSGGTKEYSLDIFRSFIRSGCRTCIDMTAEFADISVGSVEGIAGWNTVIIRSQKGSTLIREAKSEGLIETKQFPATNLSHLTEASLIKKKRGLETIRQNFKSGTYLSYLEPSKSKVEVFISR